LWFLVNVQKTKAVAFGFSARGCAYKNFLRPFCEQFVCILVESKAGKCAQAKTFMQSNALEK